MKATESLSIRAEAHISECGNYRYWLSRIWNAEKPVGAFVCINPSKATALVSDPTMSNCNNLAIQWDWGGFYIVNLFGYRATDPEEMKRQADSIGSLNNEAIKYVISIVDHIVLAWGNGNKRRATEVLYLLRRKELHCIAKNKSGGFLHPSRIKVENYLRMREA